MEKYFISTVRYDKLMENGSVKTVNKQYLIEALSFTEAESRTVEELKPYISGDFTIPTIVKPRINELVQAENPLADRWYKVKLSLITIDEVTATEKKTSCQILVSAATFEEAYQELLKHMQGTVSDYEIASIVETAIKDYFPASNGKNDI